MFPHNRSKALPLKPKDSPYTEHPSTLAVNQVTQANPPRHTHHPKPQNPNLSKDRQALLSLENSCKSASNSISQQIKSLDDECRQIREEDYVFKYCSESLSALQTVSKNFLPQLFELKNLADEEEHHDVKKAVRQFKKSK